MKRTPIPRTQKHDSAAFTLVELAVVVAILVAISAMSFPSLVSSYEEQKLRQAAIETQSQLLRARSLAQRLQGLCGVTINSPTNPLQLIATPAPDFSGTNICTSSTLTRLDLQSITNVRGLAISNNTTNRTGCSGSGGCKVVFIPLGVLAGTPQTLYLSGTGTSLQYCINISLALIRVGFLNSGSSSCNYSRG